MLLLWLLLERLSAQLSRHLLLGQLPKRTSELGVTTRSDLERWWADVLVESPVSPAWQGQWLPTGSVRELLVSPSPSSPHSLASISMGAPHPAVRTPHRTSSFQGERLGTSSPEGGLPFPWRLVDGPHHPSDSNAEITLSLKNHLVWMCSS